MRVAALASVCTSALPVMNTTLPAQNNFNLQVFAPDAKGTYPVILFVGGVGADVPVKYYSDLLTRISSVGYVIVGLGHFAIPNYPKQGADFSAVMDWSGSGALQSALTAANVPAKIDVQRAAVMAQSAGNHIVGQGLVNGCSIAKAFVMIDPVDGIDPFGVIHAEDLITPGAKLNFTTPVLHLDNVLDTEAKGPGLPACAPAKLTGDRWYNAMNGPIWNVHAANYGHVDCLDDGAAAAGGLVCPSDSNYPNDAYRMALADATTLFLGALFDGASQNLNLVEDATHFKVNVTTKFDLKGKSHSQILPGCENTPAMV